MLGLVSRTTPRVPCAPRRRPAHVVRNPHTFHARPAAPRAAAGPGAPSQRSEAAEAAILRLTDGLRLLEIERDEAVKTAEDCAKTAVKLEEMTRLLEKLALNKVAEGDDEGARQVLQEKAAVQEILSRTGNRATTNYALAAKLAEKIGQQQNEIMSLLNPAAPTSTPPPSSSSSSSSGGNSSRMFDPLAPSSSTYSSSSMYSSPYSSSSSDGSNGGSTGSSGGYEAPWVKSLREARERVAEEEAKAVAAGQAAGYRARETIEEARGRLRQQALESVEAARSRIRRSATESIEEARARIAAADAAALAEVHKVVARYKGGSYVSDAELDWAFSQLERRSWRE